MGSTPESINEVKSIIEPFVKPREEVQYIRRVLALHLRKQHKLEPLQVPLSLAASNDAPSEKIFAASSLHGQFSKALGDNVKARQNLTDVRTSQNRDRNSAPVVSRDIRPTSLEEHINLLKIKKKQERLVVLGKHLDSLTDQPDGLSNPLEPGVLFKGGPDLPVIPQEVVSQFAMTDQSEMVNLDHLLDRMEKVLLRTKFQLQQEERFLEEVRRRTASATHSAHPQARFQALNATRNELIDWIESELGKAAADEAEGTGSGQHSTSWGQGGEQTEMSEQLLRIKQKYASYILLRRDLLVALSERVHQPTILLPPTTSPTQESQASGTASASPSDHLLVPFLEKLLDLSRQQKGHIQHKAHVLSTIAKVSKEAQQMFDHLNEESQLLVTYPPKHPSKTTGNFADAMANVARDGPGYLDHVKPWVVAADAAKITTLEVVAEKVEEGQLALEGSMRALQEIDQLLAETSVTKIDDQDEEDIWMAGEPGANAKAKRQTRREMPKQKTATPSDPWSVLQGNLGLIG